MRKKRIVLKDHHFIKEHETYALMNDKTLALLWSIII